MKPTLDSARRRFLWNAGAALSAPLALAAANAAETPRDGQATLASRLVLLEDLNEIRALNQAFVTHVNAGAHDAVASLFADPAEGRLDAGIRSLAGDPLGGQDAIEIDGKSATARLFCTATTETAIGPSCPLVEMARAQGGGIVARSERGVLESTYVKRDGHWKIEHSAFRPA